MSFVVETGVALSTANSYLSVADADAYHVDHGNPSAWSEATEATKENALRLATQYLDIKYNGRWEGIRATSSQSLSWPRSQVYDGDGYALDSDVIPQKIKDAIAELALRVVNGDTLLDDIDEPGTIKSESVKAGPIETSTEYMGGKSQVKRYPKIESLLRGLMMSAGIVERG